jgi:hypothetical protein
MRPKDLTGQRFGSLIVVARAPNAGRSLVWTCQCDCGSTKDVRAGNLQSGHTQSCGCRRREVASLAAIARSTKHGMAQTREYNSWVAMKDRCSNPSHRAYPRYGGKGISVCVRWIVSFENFYADMGPRPAGTSLDRRNSNGDYEPGNCRWATALEQRHNRVGH